MKVKENAARCGGGAGNGLRLAVNNQKKCKCLLNSKYITKAQHKKPRASRSLKANWLLWEWLSCPVNGCPKEWRAS